jgi:hypothetical protein
MEVMLSEGSLASRASATRRREKGTGEERDAEEGERRRGRGGAQRMVRGRVALVEMI